MYKCSECGIEFETAPKYCECGNDIFINVEEQDEFVPHEIEDDIEIPVQTSKYHGGRRNSKKFSVLGLSIFWLCIILSLLVLFVIANPQKDLTKLQTKIETAEKIVIPSIDSYWDNTPAKAVQKEELQPQKQENILDKIVQQIVPQEQPQKQVKPAAKVETSAPISQKVSQSAPKTVQKATPKPISKPSSTQTGMTFEDLTNKIRNQYSAKNSVQPQKQTTQTTQTTTQAPLPQKNSNITQVTAPQTSNQTAQKNLPVTKSQTQTQSQSQTTAAPAAPQKSQAQLVRELEAYKSGLRNSIASKIDFTKVIGDGDCALSFKLNSNGRLTSKAFTKQSSNITLNDAVFNALNTTTSYNPPPEGYNGEILRLNIRFYNGNFEVSLH